MPGADQDIFDLRQVDRVRCARGGAAGPVRGLTLPLDGYDELDAFFARFMIPA